MSIVNKSVSRRYAINEFKTVGLVLIIYCLFVLFVPMVLKELLPLLGFTTFKGLNVYFLSSLACLILGTLLPFALLRVRSKKKFSDFNHPLHMSLGDYFVNFIVFFAVSAGAIFLTMMIGQYVNVSGQLVAGIGVAINAEYLDDIIYIIAFILISPALEEYAFRGVLLNCLSRYGKYFATIASSLIYALAHGSFVEMLPSFIMGYILSKISLYHKSIKPTIFIHVLFNLLLYVLFIIPERHTLYVLVGMGLLLILAIVLLVSKTYRVLRVNKSGTNEQVGMMFLSTSSVLFALSLFILHSILLMFI